MSFTAGGSGFQNPIVGGGGELIIDNIHSRGYVQGSTGWAIFRDGSAEFADVDMRGIFTARLGNSEVRISAEDPPWTLSPAISLNPDIFAIFAPALLQAVDISDLEQQGQLNVRSPYPVDADLIQEGKPSSMFLRSDDRTGVGRFIEVQTDHFTLSGGDSSLGHLVLSVGNLQLDTGGINLTLGDITVPDGTITEQGNRVLTDGSWTALTLAAGFTGTVEYQMRDDNTVRLRGQANHAGAASGATILTLPLAIRPARTWRFPMACSTSANGGTIRVDFATTGTAVANFAGGGTFAFCHFDGMEYNI